MLNLAGNSVKYNKKNGSVTVWCRELSHDDNTAEFMFACTDTGIGMSKDFQKRVFEPFTQEGRENLHTRYDGSGLGLSIVKGLVEQMDGKIEFESEEGVGTSFFVTLPFKIDKGHCVAVEEVADDVDISGVKVLMAEDNDVNTEIARFFLERMGVEVTSVTNGSEAVEAFKRSEPRYYDLILMDIMMPVLDGHEASKMIRELPRSDAATIPIIAMSANAFQDDIKQSRAIGMNDHLAKPFSSDQLVAVIGKYIRKQRLKEDI